ncbi:uncharacterized protein HMPREF1120_00758 [Exophiala dermatitidis NIH/UT8656]|uniref:Uncharacterized protein n=1 Tax=Exophiala dermatitidis (strain ATCC 34100 / CBS 525.76 / NIH/UT8656) TaxID=858893 RepID=H6BKB3_EXODN|nr:uncharacterized protein HMPREF1120_00758 [Exophiala dermatitidis NIH/UT8656]EHY52547.1 hypothetical protein HMPREF1120_00758 [Exophiala dermatitidis NIH/UT8656]
MARLFARMPTSLLSLATFLLTMLTSIFTFPRLVARRTTCMGAALQHFATDQTAKHICPPAGLIFECFLSAKTIFLSQKRTFRTILLIWVAIMRNLRMAAILRPRARKVAWRRLSTTGEGSLKYSPTATAGYVIKNGLFTAATRSTVAQVCTVVVAAF